MLTGTYMLTSIADSVLGTVCYKVSCNRPLINTFAQDNIKRSSGYTEWVSNTQNRVESVCQCSSRMSPASSLHPWLMQPWLGQLCPWHPSAFAANSLQLVVCSCQRLLGLGLCFNDFCSRLQTVVQTGDTSCVSTKNICKTGMCNSVDDS